MKSLYLLTCVLARVINIKKIYLLNKSDLLLGFVFCAEVIFNFKIVEISRINIVKQFTYISWV